MLPLEIVISSPDSNILDIDFLKKSEIFEERLRSLDEIKKSMSLVDHLKVINNTLNPEQGMTVPLTNEEIEALLKRVTPAYLVTQDDRVETLGSVDDV